MPYFFVTIPAPVFQFLKCRISKSLLKVIFSIQFPSNMRFLPKEAFPSFNSNTCFLFFSVMATLKDDDYFDIHFLNKKWQLFFMWSFSRNSFSDPLSIDCFFLIYLNFVNSLNILENSPSDYDVYLFTFSKVFY